ncbi:MAG: alpha-L-arabinofuranosidase C-terminal domain-containing protein, partial [Solirubrobacterales bacterium]
RSFGLPSYYVQKMFSENRGDGVLPIDVQSAEATSGPKGGAIGEGTWATQAEFKDIKVTSGGKTLFSCDFADGTTGWKFLGDGNWKAEGGLLRQSSQANDVRAIAGDKSWTDYTYSLKARKLGGAEGFLILFNVQNDTDKSWWNIGGWGNDHHAIEMGGVVGNEVKGSIETGRWYDIKIEVKGSRVRCLLDGKVIHDVPTLQTVRSLYASATRETKTDEVILKVVNTASEAQACQVNLRGLKKVRGPASATVLTSESATDENTLDEPTKVAPATQNVTLSGPVFEHTFPANSVTVLRIKD